MRRTPGFLREQSKVYFKPLEFRPRDAGMVFSPGCAAVEMCEKEEMSGSIYLPDRVSQRYRPDAGWVIGAHADTGLVVGQPVLVKYGTGKQVEGFTCGDYYGDDVRFYGFSGGSILGDAYGDPLVPAFKTEWCESIVAFIDGNDVYPAGSNIMLKVKSSYSGTIDIPEHMKERDCDAEIVALGEKAGRGEYEHIKEGATAVFYDGFLTGPGASWVGDGLVIVPQESVIAVYA